MGKTCPRCDEWKIYDEFHNNKATKDGKHSYCKPCSKEYEKAKYPNGKPRKRARYYEQTYNLTLDALTALSDSQGGLCAICGVEPERPVVDHCHETGAVRGMLCDTCNRAIGLLKDNPDVLLAGAVYLMKAAQKAVV